MKAYKSAPLKTTLSICLGLLFFFFVFDWKPLLFISFIIGMIGLFFPNVSRLIERIWMKLAEIMSLIIPNILLGVVFYLILFPISLLSKLFRAKDPLQLKDDKASMFIDCSRNYQPSDFKKMW